MLLGLPYELILIIADSLDSLKDINALLRANHYLSDLLGPVLLKRAANAPPAPPPSPYSCGLARTVLHWASAHGHERLVTKLLKAGSKAAINDQDSEGRTPLHSATVQGNVAVVKILVDNGADTEVRDRKGWTPLHYAAFSGQDLVVWLLVEKGADMEAKEPLFDGKTALHHAAANGRKDVVRLLVQMGAEIDAVDDNGTTAVQHAMGNKQTEVVELLLRFGAASTGCASGGWSVVSNSLARMMLRLFLTSEKTFC